MQKLKTFPQKLNENLPKTQGFFQKLNQAELSGPIMFQSGVQKKACAKLKRSSMSKVMAQTAHLKDDLMET